MIDPSSPQSDVFPVTAATWLGDRLACGDGGRDDAVIHVMRIYREPLLIYAKGSSLRTIQDPEELVHGFFADRLSRVDYLDKWRRSGLPLRRWLINGLIFFAREQGRHAARNSGGVNTPVEPNLDETVGQYTRSIARAVVAEALTATIEALSSEGRGEHARLFVLHYIRGMSYDQISESGGVEPRRAAVMVRTATRRFRITLRGLIAWPGATDEDIETELSSLLNNCGAQRHDQ